MKIGFYTPAQGVTENCFGCASAGFTGQWDPLVQNFRTLPHNLEGDFVWGSYAHCLENIPEKEYQAAIVLLGNAGGENSFVEQLAKKVKAPLVGGGAAMHPVTGQAALLTGQQQAAVFLIRDPRFTFEVCCENIHQTILSEHRIGFTDPRQMDTVDGVDAAKWLARKKAEFDLAEGDFEHLTFSDLDGINAHLSMPEEKIRSGRDLQPKMLLRYVSQDLVRERMARFYDDPYAIIFGCAGLKGLLNAPLESPGLGLFLYGEVCTAGGVSQFGNLMLSKLRILPKIL